MIHIRNQHDPGSALLYVEKVLFDTGYETKYTYQQSVISSVHVQSRYKSRQKAEIETGNK